MAHMGKHETQFLKKIADGLDIRIDDGLGSGGPGRSYRKGDFNEWDISRRRGR